MRDKQPKTPKVRKPMNRGTSQLKRSRMTAAKRPMRKAGKKTVAWSETRAQLKPRFLIAGITTCELKYDGCWRDNALSFCHSRKRRNITTQEQLEEVILGCTPCHDRLEVNPEMERIVKEIINARTQFG